MSASDAAPLPRLGEVFFDVRGNSRSMRLSWYADTGVAVLSIWQGGMCTGTFRLAIDDLPRMVETLQRGPDGQRADRKPPAAGRQAFDDARLGATAGMQAVEPLPGGGLPDYQLAHPAPAALPGYQAGPTGRHGEGRHSETAGRHSDLTEYLPGTGQYEAAPQERPPGTRQYPTGPGHEAMPPGQPVLPDRAMPPGQPVLPDRAMPPGQPRPPGHAGPTPFLTGPEGYQAEPPGHRTEYLADPPGPGHDPGAAYPHGAAGSGRYQEGVADDPYLGGAGMMDYEDAPHPAYYPLGSSAPGHGDAGGRSDADYAAHYGTAVTDDNAPGPAPESFPYGRPPRNRGA